MTTTTESSATSAISAAEFRRRMIVGSRWRLARVPAFNPMMRPQSDIRVVRRVTDRMVEMGAGPTIHAPTSELTFPKGAKCFLVHESGAIGVTLTTGVTLTYTPAND